MTLIESTVLALLTILTLLTPADDVSFKELTSPANLPHVYVLPKNDFEMSICGCPCQAEGVFAGIQEVNKVTGSVLIMKGNENGHMYVQFRNPQWDSVMYHELIHYRQMLQGKFSEDDFKPEITDEHIEYRKQIEREASEGQNDFNAYVGLPPIDVEKSVYHSTMAASGKVECLDGSEPNPKRSVEEIEEVILKTQHNRDLNEIYRKRVDNKDEM